MRGSGEVVFKRIQSALWALERSRVSFPHNDERGSREVVVGLTRIPRLHLFGCERASVPPTLI